MAKLGSDWLYIAGGLGIVYLVWQNTKPLNDVVTGASRTVTAATDVLTPLLTTAGKGASIVTNPDIWKVYTPYQLNVQGDQALRMAMINPWDLNYWLNIPYATLKRGWS